MRDDFTAEEITELRQKHGVCKDKRDADRIKAIYLLGLKYSVVEVARVLMIDEETVRNYERYYKTGGISELLKNKHKGSRCHLNEYQISKLEAELDQRFI